MPKVLFIAAHRPGRSPSQRFRFEQYISYLSENGWESDLAYLLNEKQDALFYSKGKYWQKFFIVLESVAKRLKDLKLAKDFDLIFIQREAFMLGTTWFEKKFAGLGKPVVFDFDDAIWLRDVSAGNHQFRWLKNPSKTEKLIRLASHVFAGNEYLARHARTMNQQVSVVPTTIDTSYHIRTKQVQQKRKVTIGWTGSSTTIRYLLGALPLLKKIKARFGDHVSFLAISDIRPETDEISIEWRKWKLETEIEDLSGIDIGIMPLPNDEWAMGKCGFKGLQYMALEIPTVMSPVGVNTEIIAHGENGLLAGTEEEWFECLSQLISSSELRHRLGNAGRQTVIERYSIESQKVKYLETFNKLLRR